MKCLNLYFFLLSYCNQIIIFPIPNSVLVVLVIYTLSVTFLGPISCCRAYFSSLFQYGVIATNFLTCYRGPSQTLSFVQCSNPLKDKGKFHLTFARSDHISDGGFTSLSPFPAGAGGGEGLHRDGRGLRRSGDGGGVCPSLCWTQEILQDACTQTDRSIHAVRMHKLKGG